jgi:hypothetical protein
MWHYLHVVEFRDMSTMAPSEGLTATELENRIRDRVGRRIDGLKVILHDHGFVLRGHVRNYYTKQLAQQAALEVGAPVLTNDIQVS